MTSLLTGNPRRTDTHEPLRSAVGDIVRNATEPAGPAIFICGACKMLCAVEESRRPHRSKMQKILEIDVKVAGTRLRDLVGERAAEFQQRIKRHLRIQVMFNMTVQVEKAADPAGLERPRLCQIGRRVFQQFDVMKECEQRHDRRTENSRRRQQVQRS